MTGIVEKLRKSIIDLLVLCGFSELGKALTHEESERLKAYLAIPEEYRYRAPLTQKQLEQLRSWEQIPENAKKALQDLPLSGLMISSEEVSHRVNEVLGYLIEQGAIWTKNPLQADLCIRYTKLPQDQCCRTLYVEYRGSFYELDGCYANEKVAKLVETIATSRNRELTQLY